jgi:glucans biosynthesis protein
VEQLGVAPLTGMFLYGENKTGKTFDDFRPEVHDCDGLSLSLNRQEWIWRPLINPDRLFVNVFRVNSLHGFGLMQRDENFDHYLNLEQHLERRPSVWVVPRGDWGTGSVNLIQIPTTRETDDNIVAFWVPDRKPSIKEPYDMSYSLVWSSARLLLPPLGSVTYTNTMHDGDGRIRFIVEFNGRRLAALASSAKLTASVSAPSGVEVQDVVITKNDVTDGWRLIFKVKTPEKSKVEQILPQEKEAVELRATLQKDGRPLTETWSYAFDLP